MKLKPGKLYRTKRLTFFYDIDCVAEHGGFWLAKDTISMFIRKGDEPKDLVFLCADKLIVTYDENIDCQTGDYLEEVETL
jgi:hypothetical protein